MAFIPDFLNNSAPKNVEKAEKESNEDRFKRLTASPLPLSCESTKPQGGKGSGNTFIRVKCGEEELFNFNMGVVDTSNYGVAHNEAEAALCRKMAHALLAQAAEADKVNAMINAHLKGMAETKVAQIRARLDGANTPAGRRDVVKAFGLHSTEMESLPNGKKLDEAIEEMLVNMIAQYDPA